MDADARTRAAIMEHWRASEEGDGATEHAIYAVDGILDYPQSRERFRGRATMAAQRWSSATSGLCATGSQPTSR